MRPEKPRIRAAVVGAGQMARRVYLPVLARHQDVELAVLAEPDAAAREAMFDKYRFARAVPSAARIRPGEADVAFLLTRHDCRREPFEALMDRGLDVHSEKPMAADLDEAETFTQMAAERERLFMVGFNRRYMPCYLKALEFVAGRRLRAARVWKHGCNLWAHSLHVIDVLRMFCGEPVAVSAEGDFDEEGRETVVAAIIRFDSGTVGVFESTRHYGMRKDELEAHGENFSVRVYAPDECIMYETGRETTFRHGKDVWFTEGELHYGFTAEIDHFLHCHRTRQQPVTAASEAIKSHRLAQWILDAMRGPSQGGNREPGSRGADV